MSWNDALARDRRKLSQRRDPRASIADFNNKSWPVYAPSSLLISVQDAGLEA